MGPGNVTGLSLKADDKGAYRACRGGARFGISYWASDAPLTSGICLAQVFLGHESLLNNVALESSPAVPAPPGGPSLPLHGGMVSGEPWSWWARTPPESVYYCVHSPWGPCCLLGARGQDTCLSSGVSSVNSMASYPGKHLGAGTGPQTIHTHPRMFPLVPIQRLPRVKSHPHSASVSFNLAVTI